MRVFIPRFLGAIAYLVVLTVVGTIAYVAIEGWAWQEALYMTVITVTSAGYAEVRPLSEPGRNFTMILAGRTLIDARIPQETGLIVIAMRKQIDETREFGRVPQQPSWETPTCSGTSRGPW
jgi:hypothetical protein